MGFPLVISFYTPEYECEVAGFIASLERFNMEHYVKPIKNRGSWRKNVGYKPRFILEQLQGQRQPVLFCDVDAVIEGPCPLLRDIEDQHDFAGRFIRQQPTMGPGGTSKKPLRLRGRRRSRGRHPLETITSGTIWFNSTPAAMDLLQAWIRNEKGQYLLGQIVLAETWHHDQPEGLRTLRLPTSYCWHTGVKFEGPSQIRHTRGAKRHRGEAGGFQSFQKQTEGKRRRTGIRWSP